MNERVNITDAATAAFLVYNGEIIHQRDEMLSLTNMWKAAGSPSGRGPNDWRVSAEASRFIETLTEILGVGNSHCDNNVNAGNSGNEVFQTVRGGRNPGTWAHWQVGLAYAKYLSPEFHMWCNTVVRERMEGKVAVSAIPADVLEQIRRTDGISRMLSHKVTGTETAVAGLITTIASLAATVTAIANVVQPHFPVMVRHGRTAGQIWHANGFPPIKITCWFGNRLVEAGCLMEGCADVGLHKVRLFDPDKADIWLKNGGRLLAEQKVASRSDKGQGVIPFPKVKRPKG